MDIFWIVVNGGGYILAVGGRWWMVVDIFWLVVGGGWWVFGGMLWSNPLGICKTWWRISPKTRWRVKHGGRSKAAATSRMELLLAVVINGWHPWTIVTKCSILDALAVLDSLLHLQSLGKHFFMLLVGMFSIVVSCWMFSLEFPKNLRKIPLTEKFEITASEITFFDVFYISRSYKLQQDSIGSGQ